MVTVCDLNPLQQGLKHVSVVRESAAHRLSATSIHYNKD